MDNFFFRLTPDIIIKAIEDSGLEPTGHCLILNSYENRVFDLKLEDNTHVVSKFYRPGRWTEEQIMEDFTKAKENIKAGLSNYFSPEFLNRIDKVVVFNPLNKINIKKIVILRLEDLEKRLLAKEITLKYNTKVISYIAKEVYNPQF